MAFLVCKVKWKDAYQGIERENQGKKDGENWNFLRMKKRPHPKDVCVPKKHNLYGHVNVAKNGNIRIQRLGANRGKCIDGVSVVFCADRPSVGLVVVGWYKKARVYKNSFRIPRPNNQATRNVINFTACQHHLVPADKRCFRIPTSQTEQDFGSFGGVSGRYSPYYFLNEIEWRELNVEQKSAARSFVNDLCEYMENPNAFPCDENLSPKERRREAYYRSLRYQGFRRKVFDRDRKCVITKETTEKALEAAHLIPAGNYENDQLCNGIMLRTDLHRLFDANLFTFDAKGQVVIRADENGLSEGYRSLLLMSKSLPKKTLRSVQATLRKCEFRDR